MIIVYGTRSRKIMGSVFQGAPCRHCGGTAHGTVGVINYFHLFWIPMIPLGKRIMRVCLACKHAAVDREIPQAERQELLRKTIARKHMLQTFVVPIIVLGLFFLFMAIGAVAGPPEENPPAALISATATPTFAVCWPHDSGLAEYV